MKFHRHSKAVIKSRRWVGIRKEALRRDGYRCVQCGKHGRLEVDHIKPVRTHPELSFALDNLQCLCKSCHMHKTRIECGYAPISPERREWRNFLTQPVEVKSSNA